MKIHRNLPNRSNPINTIQIVLTNTTSNYMFGRSKARLSNWGMALALLWGVSSAVAEDGVTTDTVVISRVIALEGPAGAKGREQEHALQTFFGAINAAGGIHGRQIILRTSNEDLRSMAAMQRVYEAHRPFAFFLFGGTVGSTLAMRYGEPHKIPFIAPNSGANAFHQPLQKHVFNTRARYQDEVATAIKHFTTVGQNRLALVYVNDAFGQDAAQGYKEAVHTTGAHSVYESHFVSDKPDFPTIVTALAEAAPQAVICIGSSKRVSEFIALAKKKRVAVTYMTLSNNSSSGFLRELGDDKRGVIVSQIAPPPDVQTKPLNRELRALLANKPEAEISYAAMEAYVAAKVLVEGLRRAGPKLTREGLIQALESMRRVDMGGIEIDFSRIKHTGSNYVELSIVTEDGKFRR
jgi:branched-chain amino acid transport system substrate-binding protein